jgi:hemolysin III
MSSTFPVGRARDVNRAVLTATLAFGIAGAGIMAAWAAEARSAAAMAAGLVYGVTLAACALFSFLYHMLEGSPRRRLLRLLDHAAIFLLIAGTYTPFAAVALRGSVGGHLLAWVWGLALAGILGKLLLGNAYDRLFVAVYLGIGFLGVGSFHEAVAALPTPALALLVAGGAAYTVGALIYAKDIGRWTDPVWHVLVLLGKAAHFGAVALLLLH